MTSRGLRNKAGADDFATEVRESWRGHKFTSSDNREQRKRLLASPYSARRRFQQHDDDSAEPDEPMMSSMHEHRTPRDGGGVSVEHPRQATPTLEGENSLAKTATLDDAAFDDLALNPRDASRFTGNSDSCCSTGSGSTASSGGGGASSSSSSTNSSSSSTSRDSGIRSPVKVHRRPSALLLTGAPLCKPQTTPLTTPQTTPQTTPHITPLTTPLTPMSASMVANGSAPITQLSYRRGSGGMYATTKSTSIRSTTSGSEGRLTGNGRCSDSFNSDAPTPTDTRTKIWSSPSRFSSTPATPSTPPLIIDSTHLTYAATQSEHPTPSLYQAQSTGRSNSIASSPHSTDDSLCRDSSSTLGNESSPTCCLSPSEKRAMQQIASWNVDQTDHSKPTSDIHSPVDRPPRSTYGQEKSDSVLRMVKRFDSNSSQAPIKGSATSRVGTDQTYKSDSTYSQSKTRTVTDRFKAVKAFPLTHSSSKVVEPTASNASVVSPRFVSKVDFRFGNRVDLPASRTLDRVRVHHNDRHRKSSLQNYATTPVDDQSRNSTTTTTDVDLRNKVVELSKCLESANDNRVSETQQYPEGSLRSTNGNTDTGFESFAAGVGSVSSFPRSAFKACPDQARYNADSPPSSPDDSVFTDDQKPAYQHRRTPKSMTDNARKTRKYARTSDARNRDDKTDDICNYFKDIFNFDYSSSDIALSGSDRLTRDRSSSRRKHDFSGKSLRDSPAKIIKPLDSIVKSSTRKVTELELLVHNKLNLNSFDRYTLTI